MRPDRPGIRRLWIGLAVLLIAISWAVGTTVRSQPAMLGAALGDGIAAEFASRNDCDPLPAPDGTLVRVASTSELHGAIEALTDGTTILISPGTYDLERTIHLQGGLRGVAIRGATGRAGDVVLRGRGMTNPDHGTVPHGILISDAQSVLIGHLTIRDVYYHPVQVQGESGARDVALYDVRLIDAGEQFIKGSSGGPPGPYADDVTVACSHLGYTDRARDDYTNGVDVLAGARWTVRDNTFERIRAPVGQLAGPAVLFWRGSRDVHVVRNRFIDCDRGIALGLTATDPRRAREGTEPFEVIDATAWNNIVWRSASSPTGDIGIGAAYAQDFDISHNTVILNGTFAPGAIEYRFGPTTGRVANNLTDGRIWQRDGASAEVTGNVTDARSNWFVDAAAPDLHLRSHALEAIDTAVPVAAPAPDKDMDGDPRPIGAAADVGADEWWPGDWLSPTPAPTKTRTGAATATPEPSVPPEMTATPIPTGDRPPTPPAATPTPTSGGSEWRVFFPAAGRG